jgi:peptidoglycan/xylan/chitin deacetylase (PgdA/CDA1 family)
VRDLLANWAAVLKLPFVYLGLSKDFWREFANLYQLLEREFRSTFFIIPYKNRPGITANGSAPSFRASRYGAQDIADVIRSLIFSGHEVGLHGIDAWTDSSKGREELQEIQRLTGVSETGVRMHWLYFDQHSPKTLEKAGAAYDSTFGYNRTVGYRAGTTQVYKPLETTRLLELPLHVMDTALFYPSHLELSPRQATVMLNQMQNNAVRFGGVLTVNWHDRSLAPERLWEAPYRDLLAGMKLSGAWFATAGQAVSWFRMRRSATFEMDPAEPGTVCVKIPADQAENLPRLRLRAHKKGLWTTDDSHWASKFVDTIIEKRTEPNVFSGTKV